MSKEEVAYGEWLKDVSGKLPEDLRDKFDALTSHDAGKELFRGVARREDYNRRVNEISAEKQRLKTWWDEEAPKNQALVAELARKEERLLQREHTLREMGMLDDTAPGTSPRAAASVVKKEDLEALRKETKEQVSAIDRALPAFLGDLSDTIYRSIKDNHGVPPREVLAYAMENNVSPTIAYETLTQGAREKRAKEDADKEREKWKAEGAREALSKMPNPASIRPAGPTVLDTLQNKDFKTDHRSRVEESVKEFLEGQFQGGSSIPLNTGL